MRVLFVTQTPEYGGAEKHMIDLVRRIDSSIHCRILCFSEDFYSEALNDRPNVQVLKLPQIQTKKFRSFFRVFWKHSAEVIVLVKGIYEQYPLSAYMAARMSGSHRLIALEHLMPDPPPGPEAGRGLWESARRLFGWRTRYLLARKAQSRLSHVTVCVSEAIRRRLIQEYGYPNDQTVTIRNGIDLRYYSSPLGQGRVKEVVVEQEEIQKTIVCAARLSSVKRLDLLLDALALLGKSHIGWRCLILGAGPLDGALREHAQRLALLDRVSFVGRVQDVRAYLSTADLFVLSSEKEGLPLALLEAMAMGVPAVVTDVGGTGEVVIHGQNGLLVKAGSVENLEGAIAYLLVNHEERRRMGEAARLHMQQYFNIEVSMDRLKQVLLAART